MALPQTGAWHPQSDFIAIVKGCGAHRRQAVDFSSISRTKVLQDISPFLKLKQGMLSGNRLKGKHNLAMLVTSDACEIFTVLRKNYGFFRTVGKVDGKAWHDSWKSCHAHIHFQSKRPFAHHV